jgi:hypothetical protein
MVFEIASKKRAQRQRSRQNQECQPEALQLQNFKHLSLSDKKDIG